MDGTPHESYTGLCRDSFHSKPSALPRLGMRRYCANEDPATEDLATEDLATEKGRRNGDRPTVSAGRREYTVCGRCTAC